MRPPQPRRLSVVLAVLCASQVFAQGEVATTAERTHPSGEVFGARIRYGVVMREGTQDDSGPGLSYDGLTPNDLALQISYFPIDLIGLDGQFQREGFSLNNDTGPVTSGSLIRAHLGPKARVKFGPLRIELVAAFQYAQLPMFGSTTSPQFAAGTRQAVLLASRVLVDLPAGLNLHARGEYPISLSATDAAGQSATSSGLSFGGGLGYTLGWADKISYGILLDFQRVTDRLEVSDGTVSTQTLNRIGGGLEVAWNDAPPGPPPPKFGGLLVSVVDEESGAPLADATISLEQDGEALRTVKTAADGTVKAAELPPGTLVAKVTAGGYLPSQGQGSVIAGQDGTVQIRAKKEPPKVGGLVISVVNADGAAPVEGAKIEVGGQELTTGPDGKATVSGLNPGPVEIKITASGFQPGNEAARVTAGRSSPVPIELVEEKKKVLATITGLVRSSRGGASITADLEIPELKLKTKADAKGAFSMRVPGGTYSVIISAPGFITQQKSVTVKDGDQAIFNVDLFPGRGR